MIIEKSEKFLVLPNLIYDHSFPFSLYTFYLYKNHFLKIYMYMQQLWGIYFLQRSWHNRENCKIEFYETSSIFKALSRNFYLQFKTSSDCYKICYFIKIYKHTSDLFTIYHLIYTISKLFKMYINKSDQNFFQCSPFYFHYGL